jgi:GNAT superfamily N-acetyltransferase
MTTPTASDGAAGERLTLVDGTALLLALVVLGAGRDDGLRLSACDVADRVVGNAAYERVYGPRAHVTIEVDDAYWQRGLPAALLARLRDAAAGVGISTFVLRTQASDDRLLELLREDFAARSWPDGAVVDIELRTA